MTSFKQKPEKIKYLTSINTLDEVHRKQVDTFDSKKKALPKKKNILTAYQTELETLQKKDRTLITPIDIKRVSFLKERIDELKEEIKEISNDSTEIDYYSRTHEVLIEYYNQLEDDEDIDINSNIKNEINDLSEVQTSEQFTVTESSVSMSVKDTDKPKIKDKLTLLNELSQQKRKLKKETKKRVKRVTTVVKKKSILSYFTEKKQEENQNSEAPPTETDNLSTSSPENIVEQVVSNRASLYEAYMGLINKNTTSINKSRIIRMCNNCSTEKTLIQSEGIYVCKKCGEVEHIIIESEVPNHKDTVNEKPRYPYKRLNHLLELIILLVIMLN